MSVKVFEFGRLAEPVAIKYIGDNVAPPVAEIFRYQMMTGGKRQRPGIAIAAYGALAGRVTAEARRVAAAVELAHQYTLILDDIIDSSVERRGRPSFWKRHGVHLALMAAMAYRELAQRLLRETLMGEAARKAVDGLNSTFLTISVAVASEMLYTQRPPSLDEWTQVARGKTARLMRFAAEAGVYAYRPAHPALESLACFAEKYGLAFQIYDDIRDAYEDPRQGKLANVVLALKAEEGVGLGDAVRRAKALGTGLLAEAVSCLGDVEGHDEYLDALRGLAAWLRENILAAEPKR